MENSLLEEREKALKLGERLRHSESDAQKSSSLLANLQAQEKSLSNKLKEQVNGR